MFEVCQNPKNDIHEQFYNDLMFLDPMAATFFGDHRFSDRYIHQGTSEFRDLSRKMIDKYKSGQNSKNPSDISQIYMKLMAYQIEQQEKFLSEPFHYLCVSHLDNPFKNILDISDRFLLNNNKDFSDFKKRIYKFIRILPELEQNLLDGVAFGIVENKKIIKILINDLKNIKIERISSKKSSEYMKFMNNVFKKEAHKFAKFLEESYLKHTKKELGLYGFPCDKNKDLKDRIGYKMYLISLEYNINKKMSPDSILELGLKLVQEYSEGISSLGLKRSDLFIPENMYKSKKEVLDSYKKMCSYIDVAGSEFVSKPKSYHKPELVQLDSEFFPDAQEWAPDFNGKHLSKFKINVHNYKKMLRSDCKNLTAHEYFGHGIQIQSVVQNKDRPKWICLMGYNSTIEGFALYTESLFDYNTDFERYSLLNSKLLRAVRLVADVMIHVYGISQTELEKFMKKYLYDANIISEIYRYSVLPGQACSYMIGCCAIERMFDSHQNPSAKHFHNWFINRSFLPISMIEKLWTLDKDS